MRRMKKERGQKRTREEEKEENKTGGVERRCEGFVSVEAFLNFSVKVKTWRVAGFFLEGICWRSLRTCLIVSLILVRMCIWCLM